MIVLLFSKHQREWENLACLRLGDAGKTVAGDRLSVKLAGRAVCQEVIATSVPIVGRERSRRRTSSDVVADQRLASARAATWSIRHDPQNGHYLATTNGRADVPVPIWQALTHGGPKLDIAAEGNSPGVVKSD
jgi:hypothetical protein